MKQKQFTLIELLVVIAIIGILSSILLPSLRNARKASRAAVCFSNQKQIYIGAMINVSQTQHLPNTAVWGQQNESWMYTISKALNLPTDKNAVNENVQASIFFCPSETVNNYYGYNFMTGFPARRTMAAFAGRHDDYKTVMMSKVATPEGAWFTGDHQYWIYDRGYFDPYVLARHFGKVQGALLDGAVKRLWKPDHRLLSSTPGINNYWVNWAKGEGQ